MKKTLYLSILAAALMGGQVLADAIPTTVEGAVDIGGRHYAGQYSKTDDVSGANVTIKGDEVDGGDLSSYSIDGGYTEGEQATASNNSVTMTSGQVGNVYGGTGDGGVTNNSVTMSGGQAYVVYGGYNISSGSITNNTVTMSGGQVSTVYGGRSSNGNLTNNTASVTGGQVGQVVGGFNLNDGNANNNTANVSGGQVSAQVCAAYADKNANGNTATITGGQVDGIVLGGEAWTGNATCNTVVLSGCIVGGDVTAGQSDRGVAVEASNNHVYLLGKGASAVIGGKAYTGGDQGVTVAGYVAAYQAPDDATTIGNSIEVYGSGITAATLCSTQMVNFHIADGVLLSQEAMVSLTSTSDGEGLDLTGVELGFNADAVQDWSAYEGQSITLVQAAQSITIDAGSLGDVEIKDANGLTVATAMLELGGSNDVLTLTDIKGVTPVPEPTTGALGLLALAGLCARRRK